MVNWHVSQGATQSLMAGLNQQMMRFKYHLNNSISL